MTSNMQDQMADLTSRIKKLEDAVFNPPSGGSPEIEQRLQRLEEELNELDFRASTQLRHMNEKIRKTIRIVAELRDLVGQLGKAQAQRVQIGSM